MRLTRRPTPALPAAAFLALTLGSVAGCSGVQPVSVVGPASPAVPAPEASPADASAEPSGEPTGGPQASPSPSSTRAPARAYARSSAIRTLTPQALTPPKVTPLPESATGAPAGAANGPGAARTAASAPDGRVGTAGEEREVLRLTNLERVKVGCPALTRSTVLTTVARAHSKDMAVRSYFTHNSLDGRTPFQRMTTAGYRYRDAAENIAAGQPSAADVVRDWMLSPGHRENIEDCGLREIGIGLYISGASTYTYYWTQDFGTPR